MKLNQLKGNSIYEKENLKLKIVYFVNESKYEKRVVCKPFDDNGNKNNKEDINDDKYLLVLIRESEQSKCTTLFKPVNDIELINDTLKINDFIKLKNFSTIPLQKDFTVRHNEVVYKFFDYLIIAGSFEKINYLDNDDDNDFIETNIDPDQVIKFNKKPYSYLTLDKIVNLLPVKELTYVNTYGIIRAKEITRSHIQLTIFDEHVKSFYVYIVLNKDTGSLLMKTGDIVRLHRLQLKPQETSGYIFSDKCLIAISGFKSWFKIRNIGHKFTLTDFDLKRKSELDEYQAKSLNKINLSDIPDEGYFDVVAQVIGFKWVRDEVGLLYIWDGSRSEYSQSTSQAFNVASTTTVTEVDESFDQQLKEKAEDKYIELVVYDSHAKKASKIKFGSFIVVFNARMYHKKFILYGDKKYGKSIRLIQSNSILYESIEKKINSNIEYSRFINLSSVNFDDEDDDLFSKLSDDVLLNGINLDESKPKSSSQESHRSIKNVKRFKMVDILDHLNKNPITFSQDKDIIKIKAKVYNYFPFYHDLLGFINVLCHKCSQLKFVSEISKNIDEIKQMRLKCNNCNTQLEYLFAIDFILKDECEDSIFVRLDSNEANNVLNVKPDHVLNNDEEFFKMKKILSTICRPDLDWQQRKLFTWYLKKDEQFDIFRVISLRDSSVTDKSFYSVGVGCNLSGLSNI